MAKIKEKKSKRFRMKLWHYGAGVVLLIIAYLVIFQIIAPEPTTKYLSKVVKTIGVPGGYSYSPAQDNTCDNGAIGGSTCFIRYYAGGPNTFDAMKNMMLKRVKQAGFSNATWI